MATEWAGDMHGNDEHGSNARLWLILRAAHIGRRQGGAESFEGTRGESETLVETLRTVGPRQHGQSFGIIRR